MAQIKCICGGDGNYVRLRGGVEQYACHESFACYAEATKPPDPSGSTRTACSTAYRLERTYCTCHWQTCNCDDYSIYKGEDLICTGNNKTALERMIKDANRKR